MLEVIITEGISQESIIYKLTTIVYDLYQLPVVCDIVNYPLELEDHCLLIKKQLSFNLYEYFLTLKINEKIDEKQQKAIDKLLSLSDKIICFQLSHEIQSRIEKQYISLIPELYAKYSQRKLWIKKPSISFINESYRKFYSRQAQGIFYYKNSEQYLASFLKIEEKGKEKIRESQPFLTSLKSIGEAQQVQKKDDLEFPGLTVAQFFSIYNDLTISEKQACQLKYSIINFKQSEQDEDKKQKSLNYLFEQGFNDLNKKVLREIQKYEKDKNVLKRLESKYNRMRNFSDLVYQQANNRGLVKKYKNCSIFELHQDTIFLQVKQFYRFWVRNTLKVLKTYFNAIANRRDIKTINDFRSKYSNCMEIINKSMEVYDKNTENFKMVEKMRKELQQFITIHEKVIRNEYPSIIKYFPYQLRYFWQNEPKIYYKCGLVLLILLFAYLQGNILLGVSLFSIGIILMLINI